MKPFQILLLICIIGLSYSCNDITGIEKHHAIPEENKFLLKEHDTLTFQCENKIEKYDIAYLVNGQYYQYRSGTCMKGALDIIDFQAVLIKSVDSIAKPVTISKTVYDCDAPPYVNNNYICIIKNLVNIFYSQGIRYDGDICWYSEFHDFESSFSTYHNSLTLNGRVYKKVFEYDLSGNSNSDIEILYYTMHYGFVGYKLKSGEMYNLVEPGMKY